MARNTFLNGPARLGFGILLLTLSAIVCLCPTRAQAQEPRKIALSEAIRIALERNLTLRQTANQVELDETSVQQERANFYPNLNLSVNPSQRYGQVFDPASGGYSTRANETLNLTTSSSINLFNGFGDMASYRAARRDLDASRENLSHTRQRITYEAASRFLQVNLNREMIRIEEENLKAQRRQLERIQAFYEEGTRARADVLQQQVAVARAELRLLNAERTYEVSKLNLKQTLDLPPSEAVGFASVSLDLAGAPVLYDPAQLIQAALSERADVRAQQQRIAAAEAQIYGAKAGYWPALSLSVSTGTNYSSQSQLSGFSSQLFDHNPSATVGLSLTIPIFDRSRTRSSVARAQVQFRNEQLGMENLRQSLAFDVQKAVLDYRTAVKQLGAAEVGEQAAREALSAMEERYHVGAATLVELSQARADYVDAAGQRVEAQYNSVLQRLNVEFYQGNIEQAVTSL